MKGEIGNYYNLILIFKYIHFSNDFLAMTAMMYLNNQQNNQRRFDSKANINTQTSSEKERDNIDKKEDYEDLINKLKFYDDPLLYSSDEEGKKKKTNSNTQNLDHRTLEETHKN
jgi:hypothetical protein